MGLAKLKEIYNKPEVKALVYMLLGLVIFVFLIVICIKFPIFMLTTGLVLWISIILYLIWWAIMIQLKRNDRNK